MEKRNFILLIGAGFKNQNGKNLDIYNKKLSILGNITQLIFELNLNQCAMVLELFCYFSSMVSHLMSILSWLKATDQETVARCFENHCFRLYHKICGCATLQRPLKKICLKQIIVPIVPCLLFCTCVYFLSIF